MLNMVSKKPKVNFKSMLKNWNRVKNNFRKLIKLINYHYRKIDRFNQIYNWLKMRFHNSNKKLKRMYKNNRSIKFKLNYIKI